MKVISLLAAGLGFICDSKKHLHDVIVSHSINFEIFLQLE